MFRHLVTRRRLAPVAVLAALVLFLAACTNAGGTKTSSQQGPTGKPINGGTVTFAETQATTPNWIFPFASIAYFSSYNISQLQQLMYRPLYWFGGHNLQPSIDYGLSAAQAPKYSSNGKTVTMTLKPWKWSNGEDVNANDVVFWMNMMKAEKANWAGYVPGFFPDNVTKVTKVNNSTVKFSLNKKYSTLWYTYNQLSQITPMPMAWDVTSMNAKPGSGGCTQSVSNCKAVYNFLVSQSKNQKTYATSKLWGVVNGPWRLKNYSSDGHYSMVPNPKFSGQPKPRLDEIKFLPFTTDTAEYNVLKAGGTLDIGYIPSQDLPQRSGSSAVPTTNPLGSGWYLLPQYLWWMTYYIPNFNNPDMGPAFKQLYVRQALQLTLNQPLGVQKAFRGYGYQQFSPVPAKPASQWQSPLAKKGPPYPFSISRAKKLFTDHGWTMQGGVMTCTNPGSSASQCGDGISKGKKMSIKFDYASGSASLDQQIQQYKSDAAKAGIDLNLHQEPFNSVIGEAVPCKPTQSKCNWQVANWGGGWIYAPDFLPTGETLFATGSSSNSGNYSDPKMDSLIQNSLVQSGTQAFYKFSDFAMKQLPVIYQSANYSIYAVSNHVGGVILNPLATLNPEYWYRTK